MPPTEGTRRGTGVLALSVQSLTRSQMFQILVIAQIQKKIVSSFRFKKKKTKKKTPTLSIFFYCHSLMCDVTVIKPDRSSLWERKERSQW